MPIGYLLNGGGDGKVIEIFVPQNATNGDVIKALFYVKDVEEMECCTFASIAGDSDMRVYKDWWNALYKREGDGECKWQ